MQGQPVPGQEDQPGQRPALRRAEAPRRQQREGRLEPRLRLCGNGRHAGAQWPIPPRPDDEAHIGPGQRRIGIHMRARLRPQRQQPVPQPGPRFRLHAGHGQQEHFERVHHDVVQPGEMVEDIGLADARRPGQGRCRQRLRPALGHQPDRRCHDRLFLAWPAHLIPPRLNILTDRSVSNPASTFFTIRNPCAA